MAALGASKCVKSINKWRLLEVLRSCFVYTLIHFFPNLKKTNTLTIKVSVNIGLGMVCKQLHNQKSGFVT